MRWTAVLPFLVLVAGCFGECGPTLHQMRVFGTFDAAWSSTNETQAMEALEASGFRRVDSTQGVVFTRDATSVRVRAQEDNVSIEYALSYGNEEYDGWEHVDRVVDERRPAVWQGFNETTRHIEARTGWNRVHHSDVAADISIC